MSVQFFSNESDTTPLVTLNQDTIEDIFSQQTTRIQKVISHNLTSYVGTWSDWVNVITQLSNSSELPAFVQIYNGLLNEVTMEIGEGPSAQTFTAYSQRLGINLYSSHLMDQEIVTINFRRIHPRPVTKSTVLPKDLSLPNRSNNSTGSDKPNRPRSVIEGFRESCAKSNVFYYLIVFILLVLALFLVYFIGCGLVKTIKK